MFFRIMLQINKWDILICSNIVMLFHNYLFLEVIIILGLNSLYK